MAHHIRLPWTTHTRRAKPSSEPTHNLGATRPGKKEPLLQSCISGKESAARRQQDFWHTISSDFSSTSRTIQPLYDSRYSQEAVFLRYRRKPARAVSQLENRCYLVERASIR